MTEGDQWLPEEDRTAANEYLIAFGQITLLYNFLESMMERLFRQCAPLIPGRGGCGLLSGGCIRRLPWQLHRYFPPCGGESSLRREMLP